MQKLTISALQTKTDTYVSSVDPDVMACNKSLPFHFFFLFLTITVFAKVDMSDFKYG